jgi:hypothetical protein
MVEIVAKFAYAVRLTLKKGSKNVGKYHSIQDFLSSESSIIFLLFVW